MNIGLFTDSYLPLQDGVATSVSTLAGELQNRGHTVYIIAPNHPKANPDKRIYRIFSIPLSKKPEFRAGIQVPQPALLKISATHFTIIHGHTSGPVSFLGWQIARLQKIPFIKTYHTFWKYYTHYFVFPNLLQPWMFEKPSAIFANGCHAVIAPTQKVKDELLRLKVTKPVYIVPNGISIEKFSTNTKGMLRNMFGIHAKNKIILSVGRLEKEKSMDVVISSFALAQKIYQECILVLVGEGRDKEKLQQLAFSLGVGNKVYFTGPVPYIYIQQVYADADLFVFASHTETQGMVVTEALASGLPVVAINDMAFQKTIINGYNGYLVDKNPTEFAETIISVLQNSNHQNVLHNNALMSAKEYSISNTARTLEGIYNQLLR